MDGAKFETLQEPITITDVVAFIGLHRETTHTDDLIEMLKKKFSGITNDQIEHANDYLVFQDTSEERTRLAVSKAARDEHPHRSHMISAPTSDGKKIVRIYEGALYCEPCCRAMRPCDVEVNDDDVKAICPGCGLDLFIIEPNA